jgi:hypothetical protein
MKAADGRCGRTIEVKPVSGQTCFIEPPRGAPVAFERDGTGPQALSPTTASLAHGDVAATDMLNSRSGR